MASTPDPFRRCVWPLPDYWTVPLTRGWLHLKGHFAFGILTDGNWEADFTNRQHRYTDKVLYHSKAGYLKIGNEERFCPWSLELGLEMVTLFGGTIYSPDSTGTMQQMKATTASPTTGMPSLVVAAMPVR